MEITVQISAVCSLCSKKVSGDALVSPDGLIKYDEYTIDGIQDKWSDDKWESIVCCDACAENVK